MQPEPCSSDAAGTAPPVGGVVTGNVGGGEGGEFGSRFGGGVGDGGVGGGGVGGGGVGGGGVGGAAEAVPAAEAPPPVFLSELPPPVFLSDAPPLVFRSELPTPAAAAPEAEQPAQTPGSRFNPESLDELYALMQYDGPDAGDLELK